MVSSEVFALCENLILKSVVVHKGTWHGQTVGVKKLYRSMPRGEMAMFARECRIISSLRSPVCAFHPQRFRLCVCE